MLDQFPSLVQDLRSGRQPRGHAVQHRLVLQPRHTPGFVGRAAWPEGTGPAGLRVTVVDLLQPTHMRAVARSKPLPSRAEIGVAFRIVAELVLAEDRKSTRLNSSHANISYAVFCLKKKNKSIV